MTSENRSSHPQPRVLAVTLALALLLCRVSRAWGQESDVGYRKSYYQEDDHRINVTTDTLQLDLRLRDNLRVSGDLVMDAISGATPTGAPPQNRWPFPTLNNLYQSAYHSSYASQYNQFIANNQIYVNSGLETYQQLTNDAVSFAQLTAPGIAKNSATASYHSLTNNPNYRNNKVPLTHMHDYRLAGSLGVPITLGRHQFTPSLAYSRESDYVSFAGALNYSLSLNDKNTTLSAGWAHDGDSVRDDQFHWQVKKTDNAYLGLVQLFGPKAYLTLDASVGFERGYLADPYRGVMFADRLQFNPGDAALSAEVRPRHRNSQILYAGWTQFITPLDGSYELSYRLFHDTYGLVANTAELDWHQKVGRNIVISPMFRYYVQNAADFYYVLVPEINGRHPGFYSSDYRLSELESMAAGVAITWRLTKHASLDASYMRYIMRGMDGVTSQSAYPSSNVFSVGARAWF